MRDALDEFEEYDRMQEKKLNMRPKCQKCGRPVQEDRYWITDKHDVICESCLDDYFWEWKKDIDNFVIID